MKKPVVVVAFSLLVGACAPHKIIAVECFEHIGRPISERIAAYGPPKSTVRINATQVGYVFETNDTRFVGNLPYYEVNYLTGVDNRRTPIRAATTICRGNFIVHDDGLPGSRRIIVDIVPQN